MNLKVWLAFGLGLIFGVFGMATFVGCLMLRADELRKKALATMPRVIIGFFEVNGRTATPRHAGQNSSTRRFL